MRAIEIIMKELAESVIDGKSGRGDQKGEEPQQPRRRSARSQFRAEETSTGSTQDLVPPPSIDAPVEHAPSAEPVASA
jgi:hypothetical protein